MVMGLQSKSVVDGVEMAPKWGPGRHTSTLSVAWHHAGVADGRIRSAIGPAASAASSSTHQAASRSQTTSARTSAPCVSRDGNEGATRAAQRVLGVAGGRCSRWLHVRPTYSVARLRVLDRDPDNTGRGIRRATP
jgi:hypothetical protein